MDESEVIRWADGKVETRAEVHADGVVFVAEGHDDGHMDEIRVGTEHIREMAQWIRCDRRSGGAIHHECVEILVSIIPPYGKELYLTTVGTPHVHEIYLSADTVFELEKRTRMVANEQLAALAHDIWAKNWTYMLSRSVSLTDGTVTIPAELVERWERQAATPYAKLPEKEKRSDRDIALRIQRLFFGDDDSEEAKPELARKEKWKTPNKGLVEVTTELPPVDLPPPVIKPRDITTLDLSTRTFNCLYDADIRTLADLIRWRRSELLKLPHMGEKSVNEVNKVLDSRGLFLLPEDA